MITFKSEADLQQLPKDNPAYPVIEDLVQRLIIDYPSYDPDADGFIVLLEEDDVNRNLTEIWSEPTKLCGIPFEGIFIRDGYIHFLYLRDNQYGLLFLAPENADWITDELRDVIEQHLDP